MTTPAAPPARTPLQGESSRSLREFLRTETGSAGLLLAATVVALLWANTGLRGSYEDLWHTELAVTLAGHGITEDLHFWVNDGLMVLFFYVVGLEIRRELSLGELRDRRAAAVPALAALAGMVTPALLYWAINAGGPGAHGWGIVMATDIAFVLGALALLGDRAPAGVRVFLLTLAIVDDVGAITVIAVFYSESIAVGWLVGAAAVVALIALARRFGPPWRGPAYLVAGLVLWYATLRSGVHPTIAGVVLGLMTAVHPPARADVERAASVARLFRRSPGPGSGRAAVLELGAAVSPNERFQEVIHPWTSYAVIPVFALANAGVHLGGDLGSVLGSAVFLGVVVGLVAGKTLGIAASTLSAVRLRVGPLPGGMQRGHTVGAAGLAGIGFTVSLFVADLAFTDPALRDEAKVGVLVASVLAAAVGLSGLTALSRRASGEAAEDAERRPARLDPPFDPRFDRLRGPAGAPHTLVAYVDYECPYSRALAPVLAEVEARAPGGVHLAARMLPVEAAHPGATLAAEAALAAAALDAFWPLHDRLLAHPAGDDLGPADLLRLAADAGLDPDRIADDLRHHVRLPAVEAEVAGAERSGVPGTPTLFVDGVRYDGPHTAAAILAALAG